MRSISSKTDISESNFNIHEMDTLDHKKVLIILPGYVSKQKLPHEKDIPRSNKIKFISNKPFFIVNLFSLFCSNWSMLCFFDVLQTTLVNWRIFYRDSLLTFKKPFLWLKWMIILNRRLGRIIPWDSEFGFALNYLIVK